MIDLKKSGFTLMELLVYMAIVGIVVVIAGEAFSHSTNFRIRTDNMIKATQEAENVAMLIKEDFSQMGAKSSLEGIVEGGNDQFSEVKKLVYMDPDNATVDSRDSSSYRISPANPDPEDNVDSVIFRRVRYAEDGTYQAVEEIAWFWRSTDSTLNRQCVIIDKETGVADDGCAPKGTTGNAMSEYVVQMATKVDSFNVYPGIPNVLSADANVQMFPPGNGSEFKLVPRVGDYHYQSAIVGSGGTSVSLTGLASNYSEDGTVPAAYDWNVIYAFENTAGLGDWSQCHNSANKFDFQPGTVYELSFEMSYSGPLDLSQLFIPGRDHMSVGFRNQDGDKISQIQDYMFYPPTTANAGSVPRKMRFTVKEPVQDVSIAFTFAFFSPLVANGTFNISSLKLNKMPVGYHFDDATHTVALADKKNVKALRLRLRVKRGAKGNGKGETGEVDLVVPVPSNGPRD